MEPDASLRQAERGRRHRVTYSPVSRIAWTVEPLPLRDGTLDPIYDHDPDSLTREKQ